MRANGYGSVTDVRVSTSRRVTPFAVASRVITRLPATSMPSPVAAVHVVSGSGSVSVTGPAAATASVSSTATSLLPSTLRAPARAIVPLTSTLVALPSQASR